jgi:hypothetical protein
MLKNKSKMGTRKNKRLFLTSFFFWKFPKLTSEGHDFMDGVKVEFYEKYLVSV